MALLANTAAPADIDANDFDAIYFTGGHAVMWDFPDSAGCSASHAASGSEVASLHRFATATAACSIRSSATALLVAGKRVTGFSWTEEILPEWPGPCPTTPSRMKMRGARYQKALLPFMSYVVADGRLITGQTRGRPKRLQSRWCRLWQGARATFQTAAGLCRACPLLVSGAHELAHFFFGRCFRGQGFGLLGQYMGEHGVRCHGNPCCLAALQYRTTKPATALLVCSFFSMALISAIFWRSAHDGFMVPALQAGRQECTNFIQAEAHAAQSQSAPASHHLRRIAAVAIRATLSRLQQAALLIKTNA
jgi:putative intracellular protease/amidase